MKKLLFVFVLIICGTNLFSQAFDYGLSQEDLNLLKGQFVLVSFGSMPVPRDRWFEENFSWGRQPAVDTHLMIIIDYNGGQAALHGAEYANHLVISDDGLLHLVRDVEKVSDGIFILSLEMLIRSVH